MINLERAYCMFYMCSNLTNFKSNLNSLTNASGMFYNCTLTDESIHNIASGINRFPTDKTYNEIDIGTRSVPIFDATMNDIGIMKEKGWNPVCGGIYVDGISYTPWQEQTFFDCNNVSEVANVVPNYKKDCIVDGVWREHLSDLTHGGDLFSWTYDTGGSGGVLFTKFSADLSRMENGTKMFWSCYNLTAFDSNLNSLVNGSYMFDNCHALTNFNVKLPSLTNGINMFSGCSNLTSFSIDLSSLTNGHFMFNLCSNLTSFDSDLSNLTNGSYMFTDCKLDTASIRKIADTIKDVTGLTNGSNSAGEVYKQINIGIENTTPNAAETEAFRAMASKGWKVYVTGSSGSSTQFNPASTDGEETVTPIPFWAKPVPATEETASYIDSEGNYYNILGAQFIYGDDLSTFGMFTNEEDAAANMGLTKIEK